MGVPKIIQVIDDRDIHNHTAKEIFYDSHWCRVNVDTEDYPQYDGEVKRPSKLDEMLEISVKLSKPFKYVRIDLYEVDDGVKFGEFTFTPNSGIHQWNPKELDYTWGYIGIPE